MSLPELDIAFLEDRGIEHVVAVESGMTCVVVPRWPLPRGFNRTESDLLVRLRPGYPDLAPDMWWFDPSVLKADGQPLPATNVYRNVSRAQMAALVAAFQWESMEGGH